MRKSRRWPSDMGWTSQRRRIPDGLVAAPAATSSMDGGRFGDGAPTSAIAPAAK